MMSGIGTCLTGHEKEKSELETEKQTKWQPQKGGREGSRAVHR